MKTLDQITVEERNALRTFAVTYGRGWRGALLSRWFNGTDARDPLLRGLRNRLGPSWLVKVPSDPRKWQYDNGI